MVRGNGIHLPLGVRLCPMPATLSHCAGPRPTACAPVPLPALMALCRSLGPCSSGCGAVPRSAPLPPRPLAAGPPHTPRRGQAGAVPTLALRLPSCTSAVLPAARSRSSQLGTAMAAAPSPRQRGNFRPLPGSASGPAEAPLPPGAFPSPVLPSGLPPALGSPGTAASSGGVLLAPRGCGCCQPQLGGLETFTV